ncbi:hypothetical protein AVEN_164102-1 [Araneus ventricosus]|uniref:Uncharacterized protein n=1 Tax=Araneus ventricosus TaxID=182803 RepID=A0A4Y2JGP3_ARAVE|nr:hypothetical protein AVEN_164102-1 [Araneus ventricosus]
MIFASVLEKNLVPDNSLEPRWSGNSGCMVGALDLNFCNNSSVLRAVWVLSCMRMTLSLNISGPLSQIASRWPSQYFLLLKLKEHLPGKRFSSDSVCKQLPRIGSMGTALSSDKCLNIFGDYVEK